MGKTDGSCLLNTFTEKAKENIVYLWMRLFMHLRIHNSSLVYVHYKRNSPDTMEIPWINLKESMTSTIAT